MTQPEIDAFSKLYAECAKGPNAESWGNPSILLGVCPKCGLFYSVVNGNLSEVCQHVRWTLAGEWIDVQQKKRRNSQDLLVCNAAVRAYMRERYGC